MISSVRLDGTTACMTVAGAANTGVFPAYSPDINPIEMMWSKVKAILRSLEARDNESLLAAIGTLLSMVTATDVMGWFSHCGYNFILNALNTSSIGTKQAIGKHP